MFEDRNPLWDPMIELICPYCRTDLYPHDNQDRFSLLYKSLDDMKRGIITIRCFFCNRIFTEKKFRHKKWLDFYDYKIKEKIVNNSTLNTINNERSEKPSVLYY